MATADTVTVILLDADRVTETPVEIPARDFRYLVSVAGRDYHHCDTTPEGVWRYAPRDN